MTSFFSKNEIVGYGYLLQLYDKINDSNFGHLASYLNVNEYLATENKYFGYRSLKNECTNASDMR